MREVIMTLVSIMTLANTIVLDQNNANNNDTNINNAKDAWWS